MVNAYPPSPCLIDGFGHLISQMFIFFSAFIMHSSMFSTHFWMLCIFRRHVFLPSFDPLVKGHYVVAMDINDFSQPLDLYITLYSELWVASPINLNFKSS